MKVHLLLFRQKKAQGAHNNPSSKMSRNVEEQLQKAFKTYGYVFKDAGAVDAGVRLAKEFELSPEKFAFDFELLNSTR